MSLFAGLLSKKGDDVTPYLLNVLHNSSPAKADRYGLASPYYSEDYLNLQSFQNLNSSIGLAYKLVKIVPFDNPQPVQQHNYSFIIIGRLWDTNLSEINELSSILNTKIHDGLKKTIKDVDGSYSLIVAEKNCLTCCTDFVGNIPLYVAENNEFIGAATNKKMLQKIGLEPKICQPGTIFQLDKYGIKETMIKSIRDLTPLNRNYNDVKNQVKLLLQKAVNKRSKNMFQPAIAFSGGIDSTFLAKLYDDLGVKPNLFCMGMEGSSDFNVAEESAEALNLPLKMKSISLDDLEESLPKIINSIENEDFLQVSIAAPLFFASAEANIRGNKIIVSGNGSDEIFAGYAKYSKEYIESEKNSIKILNEDIKNSYKNNFERDWKIVADNGLELRCPYTDQSLIEYTRTIPLHYLMSKTDFNQRKIILRKIAEEIGIEKKIAARPKKAAQYSSGLANGIKKLAKRKGLSIEKYLKNIKHK
ncbi:asparagine synthetase B [Candidatus Bathyarchaeota archaeon]|nr:asparagine synthetase B [Candidatus Bathyarchaeota archaeon]